MTTCRRIDWLRQLYREATKWQHGLTQRIAWSKLDNKSVRDPNNGSKPRSSDFEKELPGMLQSCLDDNKVPCEYRPEVEFFLACCRGDRKKQDKFYEILADRRKKAIEVVDTLSVNNVEQYQKIAVIENIDEKNRLALGEKLMDIVNWIINAPDYAPVQTSDSNVREECEGLSNFKLIDWLRHMVVNCQKWLHKCQGQMKWRENGIQQDPNNKGTRHRLSQDEIKKQLLELVSRCVALGVVPSEYKEEVEIVMRRQALIKHDIALLERKRKSTVKLFDIIFITEQNTIEDILMTIHPDKLHLVLDGAQKLRKMLSLNDDLAMVDWDSLEDYDAAVYMIDQTHVPEEDIPATPESIGSEMLTLVPSPSFSDDSGIDIWDYSGTDAVLSPDEEIDIDISDLDFDSLPDLTPFINKDDSSSLLLKELPTTCKRKYEADRHEAPSTKRLKPA